MAKAPKVLEVNQILEQLTTAFSQSFEVTSDRVQELTGSNRFTSADNLEFSDLLNSIKQDALKRIAAFYQQKSRDKIESVQQELTSFSIEYQELNDQVDELNQTLQQGNQIMVNRLKIKDFFITNLQERIEKFLTQKRVFSAFKNYAKYRQRKRFQYDEAMTHHNRYLFKKVFLPWRGLSYKQGYQNRLVSSAALDIKKVQAHYMDIIKTLRGKLAETEDLIQIKRSAKAEFTYSLSRNLLKTISNLSMEVISLNQVTIKDNQINNDDNVKFVQEINQIIGQKMNEVQQMRERLAPVYTDDKERRPMTQFDV